jgi:serine/threonine protein kinase
VEAGRSYHHIDHPSTPASPSPAIRHKLSLSDFEVGKCKGEGAFGQVFLAIHRATRMLVALKKVPKEKVKYMLEQFIN